MCIAKQRNKNKIRFTSVNADDRSLCVDTKQKAAVQEQEQEQRITAKATEEEVEAGRATCCSSLVLFC
jgi:hypothetical protein